MTEIVIRPLEDHQLGEAAAVAARALVDAPTTVAAYGDDLFDRLALPYADFRTLFTALPSPQVAAFCGRCVVGVAAVTPPGGCVGSFFGRAAADVLEPNRPLVWATPHGSTCSGPTSPPTTPARSTGTWARSGWSRASRVGESA